MAKGGHISSDMEIDNGYIILVFKGSVIGLGLFIEGRITSQIPRRDLISFIEHENATISG
jgi:NOL1/NOP2/fmu family ribosome biogenesis protein